MAVDAAAGSGKTAVLIRRILRIVGCNPEQPGSGDWARLSGIVAITFTEKAAGELRAKLRSYVPPVERFRLDQAWIGTFHSFAARLLRRFGPAVGLAPSFDLLDENASGLLMRRCVRDTLLTMLEKKDSAAARLIEEVGFSSAVGALEELMQFRWHATAALEDRDGAEQWEVHTLDALRSVFIEIGRAYETRLSELGALDFQELEIRALKLLKNKSAAAACRAMWRHILVDEYQDTNDIQTELVLRLFDPSANSLFIVGDEAQSIYRFRGANVSCFARVRKEIIRRSGETVRLAHNFRSRKSIIDFINISQTVLADGLFSDPASPKPMEAASNDDANMSSVIELALPSSDNMKVAALREREAEAIAKMISAKAASGEWQLGDVVLLMRAMTSADIYEGALRKRLIPCTSSGGRGFLERREIADLLAATRFARGPEDGVALLTLLRSPIAAISDDELAVMAGGDGRGLFSAVKGDERLALISELPSMAAHMRPSEIMRRIINDAGLEALWLRLDPSGAANLNMDRLVTIARDLEREVPTTLSEFNSFMEEMRARGARLGDSPSGADSANAVRIMSVHSAKGLEFPVVFLPDLMRPLPANRNQWIFARGDAGAGGGVAFRKRNPDQPFGSRIATERFTRLSDDESQREEKESKRLLYVAMTRAAETLVLPVHEDLKARDTWHDWVVRALEKHGGRELAKRIDAGDAGRGAAAGAAIPTAHAPSISRARRRCCASHRLSVSALDSYSVCPMLYYLKYVLGLPASEVARGNTHRMEPNVYGSIVHAMLARSTKDEDELRAVAAAECLANGVEPNDKVIRELVADAIEAIDLAGASDLGEGFREMPFELIFGESTISGTIDWLRPADGGYEIVDFKTGIEDASKAKARAEEYELQMQAYALAAEAITHKDVAATRLVFPSAGAIVKRAMDEKRRRNAAKNIAEIVSGIEARDYAVRADPPCEGCIFHRNSMCWEDRLRKKRDS